MPQPEQPKTSLPLTDAEKAKKFLEGNFINIGKKVISGNPLSLGEIRLLEQMASGKEVVPGAPTAPTQKFVKNQTELAAAMGVDRKTVQRWRKHDGAPKARSDGRWDVDEWRAFAQKIGAIKTGLDKSALQAEQLLIQNERLKNKLAIERKEWIPKVVARQVFTQLVTEAKARSFNSTIRLVTLARVAANTTDAVQEVRREIEAVWKSLEEGEWFNKQTPPTS